MNQNGYKMPEWAWTDWLADHGDKFKLNWRTMAEVYVSCKDMMDLARPYLPPMNGKQIVGSGVFPDVLSAALAPKPAPYSRSQYVTLPVAPPFPKLVEQPAVRPPLENKKRTMAGREGGAPKKAMTTPRPPSMTPAATHRPYAGSSWKAGAGSWDQNAVVEPKQRPAAPPPPPSSTPWNQGAATYYQSGWGGGSASSSSWHAAPPPPPPANAWGQPHQYPPAHSADASSNFSA